MTALKKAWTWISGNVIAVLGFIIAVLAFILYQWWKTDQVNSLKDALVVSEAQKNIKALDVEQKAIGVRIEGREAEIDKIGKKLRKNRREIVEARTGAKDLSTDEIMEAYLRLGYVQ